MSTCEPLARTASKVKASDDSRNTRSKSVVDVSNNKDRKSPHNSVISGKKCGG